jgi:hypothetical protein
VYDRALLAEMEALRDSGRGAHISAPALEIHVRAVDRSVRTSSPAFVSDELLDTVAPGSVTTIAALELCLVGLWLRVNGGYAVDDADLIAHLSVGRFRRWARRAWQYLNSEPVIPI